LMANNDSGERDGRESQGPKRGDKGKLLVCSAESSINREKRKGWLLISLRGRGHQMGLSASRFCPPTLQKEKRGRRGSLPHQNGRPEKPRRLGEKKRAIATIGPSILSRFHTGRKSKKEGKDWTTYVAFEKRKYDIGGKGGTREKAVFLPGLREEKKEGGKRERYVVPYKETRGGKGKKFGGRGGALRRIKVPPLGVQEIKKKKRVRGYESSRREGGEEFEGGEGEGRAIPFESRKYKGGGRVAILFPGREKPNQGKVLTRTTVL